MQKTFQPNRFILSVFAMFLFCGASFAQCDFNVSVTLTPVVDGNLYCPNDTLTFSTTEVFDTYQWYFTFSNANQGGTAINGATQQTLKIVGEEYGFAYFYVRASKNNCTESSAQVLMDTWFFLSPNVISYPEAQFCRGDSSMVAISPGEWTNIQWFWDGEALPGGTDSILWVKETGNYVVFASPKLCPTLKLTSGLGPFFNFEGPAVPVISLQENSLVASSGPNYQWFQNGMTINGATESSFQPTETAVYTVQVSDNSGCTSVSAPFSYMVSTTSDLVAAAVILAPNPVKDHLFLRNLPEGSSMLEILDSRGSLIRRLSIKGTREQLIDLSGLASGVYYGRFDLEGKQYYRKFVKE